MDQLSHKRMLLDIVNRNYINCKKSIQQNSKVCDFIDIDDKKCFGDRIKLFLTPDHGSGILKLFVEQDASLYVREFSIHKSYHNDFLDSFLKDNFIVYDNEKSFKMCKEYLEKISYFIPKIRDVDERKKSFEHIGRLNHISYSINIWVVRKFLSSTEIQMEYNICLSLIDDDSGFERCYEHIFGASIENGLITEDFENKDKPLAYFSVDDLVYKTFFTFYPDLDTFENNTGRATFTKEICESMISINEMSNI